MSRSTQDNDYFREVIGVWESAVEAGVRMQEEYAEWLRQTFCGSGSLGDWYSSTQSNASEATARIQENVDEAIRLINQNAESSVKLMQKAMDAAQCESGPEARAKFIHWWDSALEAMQANTQATLQANSHMMKTWSDLAKKFNGEAAEKMDELAKKTADMAEKMSKRVRERTAQMARQASGDGI